MMTMRPEDWADFRRLGFSAGVVVLRPGGVWWVVCPSCEIQSEQLGAFFAEGYAEEHNATPAHRLALTL